MYRAMKIATWNVNSVRSRMDRLLVWLNKHRPDILCLQELKVTDDAFPYDPIREAGYHVAVHGQKTYNGVAILSREEPQSIAVGMGDDVADDQARLLEATFGDLTLLSAYIPNGSEVGSDKYIYKLRWLSRLRAKLERDYDPAQQLVLCGDFNVAWDDLDVANPEQWAGSVLCVSEVREAMAGLIGWGLADVFRKRHPEGGLYSWWDYRQLAFPKNDGLRLDYILATKSPADRCTDAQIDRDERKGEKPSDHAPVIAEFA
jgi:exodeoxyribonuclease-3